MLVILHALRLQSANLGVRIRHVHSAVLCSFTYVESNMCVHFVTCLLKRNCINLYICFNMSLKSYNPGHTEGG